MNLTKSDRRSARSAARTSRLIPSCSKLTKRAAILAVAASGAVSVLPHFARAQVSTFTWSDTTTNWNTNGAWTSTPGTFPNDVFNHIAYFGPRATITNQPQVTAN